MSWRGKRVLVTGAGGFIGSHLVERLVSLGAQTRAFVRYGSTGGHGWLDSSPHRSEIEMFAGDVRDREGLERALADVEVVFHLAALISIPYSYAAPSSYVRTNIEGTLNLLDAARRAGCARIVHTSTSEVYGTARQVPIDERHPLQAQSPYAATKIGADKLVEAFHASFATPVVTVRPFNTFGPRQSLRAVIPTIISQCLCGDRVRLGNVHTTRDLTFVQDTVEGFILAGDAESAIGRTINLGTGREVEIGALARLIAGLIGRELAIETEAARVRPDTSEVDRLLANNGLARELLGWSPAVSLEEGLRATIDWIRGQPRGYDPRGYAI